MEKKVTVNKKFVDEISKRKKESEKLRIATKEEVIKNKQPEFEDRFLFSSQPIPYQKVLTEIDYENEKRIAFDLDKTIAESKLPNQSYENVNPLPGAIRTLKALKKQGWYIIICTARNMRTYQHNIGQVNAKQTPLIVNWLNKWEIPFDEIWIKPHVNFFVDDKAIEFNNWDKFKLDLSVKIVKEKIEAWHNGASLNKELYEHLGWSWSEYKEYVENKVIPERDKVI